MTDRRRSTPGPMSTGALALLLALAGVGCSSAASGSEAGSDGADATPSSTAIAAPTITEPPPEPRSIRDDDITDVAELARLMAADTTGDPDWIAVFAEVRALSWLSSRYPGRYDVTTIYSEDLADEVARPNERTWLDQGVYLDEPLPRLVSVVRTRELGGLTELEVVLDAGVAVLRRTSDDGETGEYPGGRARGLFTVAQDGLDGRWRIHSVVELQVLDDPDGEDSNQ